MGGPRPRRNEETGGVSQGFPRALLCLLGAPEGGHCCVLGFFKEVCGVDLQEAPWNGASANSVPAN